MERLAAAALAALCACSTPQPCPSPLEECGGQCVDLQSDRYHCGSCDVECNPGYACLGARCSEDARAPCAVRTGGAFVTLGSRCGGSVKLWVRQPDFIAREQAYLDPTVEVTTFPLFTVLPGADCDAQWSWHVNDLTPSFLTTTSTSCDLCPAELEASAALLGPSGRPWCPSGATVLAVDPR